MTANDIDQLASAYLDGAASPEEVRIAEADPTVLTRVEELRRVRAAVRDIQPMDPAQGEARLAAALAAFDQDAPVTHLAEARRRRPSARTVRLVGAAAVVLLLVALVPLLGRLGDSDDQQLADVSTEPSDSGAEVGSQSPEPSAEDGETSAAADAGAEAPRALASLGSFDEIDSLLDAVRRSSAPAGADLGGAHELRDLDTGAACSPAAAVQPGATLREATLGGNPVLVIVTDRSDGSQSVTVYLVASCELLHAGVL
jgi:hypothetical protein